ncbi:ATP-binding cassette domain-containing protein [Phenylobacterium sp.]|uniref:ATP-binding cassette domain-containing protein n=1 Tax=Phenylobacterium sp. TaxID=1871053 RepID=UPI0035AFFEBB
MSRADEAADRRLLALLGRAHGDPRVPLTTLIVLDSLAAAGFAAGLVAALVTQAQIESLAAMAGALVVRALAAQGLARLAAEHARRVKSAVRRRVLTAALGRRRGDAASLGEAGGAVVEEVEALDGYFARYAPARLGATVAPLAICAAVALASPIAAAILLATLVPFVMVMILAGGAAAGEARRQFQALARLSGLFVDRVRALPVVLAFQAEAAETARVGEAAREVGERTLGVLRIAFVSTAALEFFAALAVALVAVYAGFSLLGLLPFKVPETIDFPRAFYALALAPEVYAPLRRLAAAYHEKQLGEAAAGRLGGWLEETAETAPRPAPLIRQAPQVVFQQVEIAFDDLVIGPVEATCPAGGLTVLLGPTGSGKTSLLEALLGLKPLAAGDMRVDGFSLAETGGFAAVAAWAGQAPALVPGSLLDNLTLAAPGVTPEAALEMARAVGLDAALARRADGAEAWIDERGGGLSGGERRRLSLARALLKPAPLLLLDEPTADLDAAAEAEIIALVRAAAGPRTVIAATHSPALADIADHVVRLA